jgi:prephenate dehydrogenase
VDPAFGRVAIIGVGLIGGSLGLALLERGLAREVTGAGSRRENLQLALEMGAINRIAASPAEAADSAELVVIATPVSATIPVLHEIKPFLAPGAVVTDVGSTKSAVVFEAEKILPGGGDFLGGHPKVGCEQNGVRGADPYLFENAFYIITPTGGTRPEDAARVREMALGVGARVIEMDPASHDLAVAAVSHLPHLLAAALVNTVAGLPCSAQMLPLAAGGFRDVTRIAAGSPVMWRDIFKTNKRYLREMTRAFRSVLDRFEGAIEDEDDGAMMAELSRARETRLGLPARTKGYLPCLFEVVFTVPDRPGVIAWFSSHLAEAGININDIEILRVREGQEGTIRLGFGTEGEQKEAARLLREQGIVVRIK